MVDFEKLGAFYLGRASALAAKQRTDDLLLYDSTRPDTHAVCVGMTGSGKTGLCLDLLEEAAIDGIPAILIDPKGDLGNLLLTFPELRPADFAPGSTRARRSGPASTSTPRGATAERWKKGLADWGQDGARIARLRAAAELRDLHAGQRAGRPLSRAPLAAHRRGARRRRRGAARRVAGHRLRACSRWSASTPTRCGAASTSCSRRSSRTPWPKGQTSTSGAHPHPVDPLHDARRRARPGVVLPGQGPLRARDGRQQPARLAGIRPLAAGRAARRQPPAVDAGGQAAHRDRLHRAPLRHASACSS